MVLLGINRGIIVNSCDACNTLVLVTGKMENGRLEAQFRRYSYFTKYTNQSVLKCTAVIANYIFHLLLCCARAGC